jgi:L-fuculose-phosphate aldolase
MMLEAEREAVAAASRRLAREGLCPGTSGNLSARSGDHVAVTPTGGVLGELEAKDITVCDLAGAVVEGPFEPTSEVGLHMGIYAQGGAGSVVHAHPPAATALACVVEEVPTVHYGMLAFGGSIRVAPYETFGTPELADAVGVALEGRCAALMANHGAVCFGPDATVAAELMIQLEWACDIYSRALAIGEPKLLSEADMQDVARVVMERGYGQTKEASG